MDERSAELPNEAAVSSHTIRDRLHLVADWAAITAVLTLPWSTSATAVCVVVFIAAALPSLDLTRARQGLLLPALALPILLWLLALLGTTWADVSWTERIAGMKPFHKLLVLPLLALHFSQSRNARFAAYAFLFSTTILLIYSWLSWAWPSLTFGGRAPGVPVKDYIYQGIAFVITICGFLYLGFAAVQAKRYVLAGLCVVAVLLFGTNFAVVAVSRTALLLLPPLLALLGLRLLGVRAAAAFLVVSLLAGSLAWTLSPALQLRMRPLLTLIVDRTWPKAKSENERRYLWTESIRMVATAPLIGHGTGTNRSLFERAGPNPFPGFASGNPHNQTFWIALQLGGAGTALLYLTWFSHLLWFRGPGWVATMGGIIVAQNILASTVNSHLADFTAGWLYILGVGILGGAVLCGPISARVLPSGKIKRQAADRPRR